MKNLILNFLDQFKRGLEIEVANKNFIFKKSNFKNVIFCGMGGSSVASGIVSDLFLKNICFHFCRDYNLPFFADENSLIIISSYSGNTSETLNCFNEALLKNFNIAIISSGGELANLAKFKNIPYFLISEKNIPPRMSIGYQIIGLIKILIAFGILNNDYLEFFKNLKLDPIKIEKKGKILAKKLINKIPIIYSIPRSRSLGYFWKTNFNENSKIHAFSNIFPEINHNEIEAFLLKKFRKIILPLFLEFNFDEQLKKSVDVGIKALKKNKYHIEVVKLLGGNEIEKIIYGIILSYWTSYYLALFLKIDPISNKNINWIKTKIKK